MLVSAKTLNGFHLKARDGDIGSVKDFYFDDRYWAVRYLVAGTGGWLSQRQVLIAPYALEEMQPRHLAIATSLTRRQIEDSPSLDSHKPVSRQYEDRIYNYYEWPTYWSGPYMWGDDPWIVRDRTQWRARSAEQKQWDPHLRSANEVRGYHIEAPDGTIGHVEDYLIDDESWAIRYLVANTRNWWPGKHVLVSPHWAERVSWSESKLFITATREQVQASPEYVEGQLPTREYETLLHGHYDRPSYWADAPATARHGR